MSAIIPREAPAWKTNSNICSMRSLTHSIT